MFNEALTLGKFLSLRNQVSSSSIRVLSSNMVAALAWVAVVDGYELCRMFNGGL